MQKLAVDTSQVSIIVDPPCRISGGPGLSGCQLKLPLLPKPAAGGQMWALGAFLQPIKRTKCPEEQHVAPPSPHLLCLPEPRPSPGSAWTSSILETHALLSRGRRLYRNRTFSSIYTCISMGPEGHIHMGVSIEMA